MPNHLSLERLCSRAGRIDKGERTSVPKVEKGNKRLVDQSKQLVSDFSSLCATMNRMADTATDLYNTTKKFNGAVKSHKWERMQDVYASLNQVLVGWERSLKKQCDYLQTHLQKNFKWTIKEFDSFSEVL